MCQVRSGAIAANGRGAMRRDEAIGVILDDRQSVPPRSRGDLAAPGRRHSEGGRILQRRVEVERLGAEAGAGVGQRVGFDPVAIHRQADEIEAKLGRDRACAGIGDRLAEDRLSLGREGREGAENGGVGAGGDEDALLRRDERAAAEP